ncbi:hypothetical protein T11_15927 [Trichinella zimbabwensis]|uniref:Uncharacterized protein n=1 Tax=Trichinella zimbabwensis TaxID=268475 RepID=A0A0V1DQ92_9BILA|nr:hypothetical protein T11_15927 [Trichinella zimbabwensis]
MGSFMISETIVTGKGFPTLITFIRFLSSFSPVCVLL